MDPDLPYPKPRTLAECAANEQAMRERGELLPEHVMEWVATITEIDEILWW